MVRRIGVVIVTVIAGGLLTVPLAGGPRSFVPDWTFSGKALTGWQSIGQADWRVENGEIVGKPKSPEGGWLVLDQQYQDVQLAAGFKCMAGCSAGVMVRAEKSADGIKGVYVSAIGGEAGAYAVRLDNQGKEIGRERLPGGGGMIRIAPPPAAAPPAGAAGAARVAEAADEAVGWSWCGRAGRVHFAISPGAVDGNPS